MKRLFAGMAAALLAAISFFSVRVQALSAEKAILLDAQSGRVLFEKNADEKSLIASTTKIMTALLICEQCNVLDRVSIPKESVGIEGSSMYLQEGEILTVQDLLYGLMLRSGNDAAVALAIYCAGTVEGFAQLMNDKARLLGMSDSHFTNPHGLDSPDHYSTPRDMACLAAYAMKNPIFSKTVSTKNVTVGSRALQNHNKLLWQFKGADGVKTGFTKAAGRILVSSATQQGRRLIAVTMNAPNDWQDHKNLLQEGFEQYSLQQIVKTGDCLGEVELISGEQKRVNLIADTDFSYALAAGEETKIVLSKPGFAYAPVVEGQFAGNAFVFVGDSVIGKIPLSYGETVEQIEQKDISFWEKFWGGKR